MWTQTDGKEEFKLPYQLNQLNFIVTYLQPK